MDYRLLAALHTKVFTLAMIFIANDSPVRVT